MFSLPLEDCITSLATLGVWIRKAATYSFFRIHHTHTTIITLTVEPTNLAPYPLHLPISQIFETRYFEYITQRQCQLQMTYRTPTMKSLHLRLNLVCTEYAIVCEIA